MSSSPVIQHVGIFGPGQSGKTTLAKALVKSMSKHGIDSLVLDPNGEDWGRSAKSFTDEEEFWSAVWKDKKKFVVCEEATETIARNQELIPVFTRIRHLGHKLCISGHSGTNLLPIMRQQFHALYLFKQSAKACAMWAEDFMDERIHQATTLRKFEFLRCIMFGAPDGDTLIQKNKLTL
jgi:hypothetical protein